MKTRINNKLGRNFRKIRTADKLSRERRSLLMSKIRSKNTKFETNFVGELKKTVSLKFKTHVKEIKGTPDIVFAKQKLCVFLDSDFWHGWQFPRWRHLLKNKFWTDKIENNRKRDAKTTRHLKRNGWRVIRFWEHQLKTDSQKCLTKIKKALS